MTKQLDTQPQAAEPMPMETVNKDTLVRLKDYTEAWSAAAQIAEQIAKTDFAGPFKGKPQDMAVAILKGASLGIPPESIGKSIYVVHGTPALYGKTALSIALRNGYRADTIEDTPKAVTVRMTSPDGQEMEVRYTIERAEKEGLVKGNSAQYTLRPSKMLYWKCVGELTDRMIPHLTGGMPVKEDIQQSFPVRATAKRVDTKTGLKEVLEAKKQPPAPDPAAFIDEVKAAETQGELQDIMQEVAESGIDDDDHEAIAEIANQRWEELGAK